MQNYSDYEEEVLRWFDENSEEISNRFNIYLEGIEYDSKIFLKH